VSWLADLKYAARSLARAPLLGLALVLSVGLGVGANAAVLGFTRGLLLRDLPLADRDRVVSLFRRGDADQFGPLSFDDYAWLRDRADVFDEVGAVREAPATVGRDSVSSVASTAATTAGAGRLLGLRLDAGLVLGRRMWHLDFGARRDAIGTRLSIDGEDAEVSAIAPTWLDGLYAGRDIDVWVLADEAAIRGVNAASRTLWGLARLRDGVSLREAQVRLEAARGSRPALAVTPYTGLMPEVSAGMSRMRRLLFAAAFVVFLIAAANVATFLLSRASGRASETSVRVALGASRGRLARLLLFDGVIVAAVGGALGVLLAIWTADIIPALFYVEDAETLVYAPDVRGIALTAGVCAALMCVCALLPLVEVRDDDPASVLRREGRGPSNAMRRLRAGLVAAQMTGCCLLVISAGLLLEGFRTSLRTRAGSALHQLTIVTVQTDTLFARTDLGLDYFRRIQATLESDRSVTSTAWVSTPPGGRPTWRPLRVEPPRLPWHDVVMHALPWTPAALGDVVLPPRAGRMFGGRDMPGSCPAVIVNDLAAVRLFDDDAVGRAVEDPAGRRVEIVGVVTPRRKQTVVAEWPAVYYYAEQMPLPVDRSGPALFRVPTRPSPLEAGYLDATAVSPDFFALMGFSTVDGDPAALGRSPCRSAVVNEEASDQFFGGHAVGAAVIDDRGQRTEIVGVVRAAALRSSQRGVEPAIYLPVAQAFLPRMTLVVSRPGSDAAWRARLERRVASVDGGSVLLVSALDAHLGRTGLASARVAATLVSAFALTALALGVLGMYGAMADAARQRRREIALRLALGAGGWRVVRQVLAEGSRLAGTGAALGMLGSVAVTWWLARVVPGASAPAPWIWVAAPATLVAVVLVASLVPARRAAAVDPLTLLRE
jgi:predicted permease